MYSTLCMYVTDTVNSLHIFFIRGVTITVYGTYKKLIVPTLITVHVEHGQPDDPI